ncbi:hypothetical protein IPC1509_11065 [Pseudomonas aeruginosa]|nr:hypothetical protein [Pseudomonas aeruginosa]MCO1942088.1 hypothetical protein [Pseudomonas aeruginosa]MCO2030710.1 hypothetical protein [Pseudomonas aeruginosa]MCO2113771.1 hypothetical protein [Pseudomonas aeruginosa]MCO2372944.1 hypothetical protein [Pseudomonas aeruginosa]
MSSRLIRQLVNSVPTGCRSSHGSAAHGALTPHASVTLFKVENDVHYLLHPARGLYDLLVIQVLLSAESDLERH